MVAGRPRLFFVVPLIGLPIKKGYHKSKPRGSRLKKLFTRAKLWGVTFAREPQWKRHWLAEPQERVRELVVILERTPPA